MIEGCGMLVIFSNGGRLLNAISLAACGSLFSDCLQ